MSVFTYDAVDVFAPTDAAGAARPVNNQQAQVLGKELQRIVDAAVSGAAFLVYTTRAALTADLAHGTNTAALVMGDPTLGYDGFYIKSGASGSGSWSRIADVPGQSFVKAAVAGTANALAATTSVGVSENQLVALPVALTNTATPVTVAFNGGAALTIKTSGGNDPEIGGLVQGTVLAGYVSGSTFRLLSDQASTAVLAQAESILAAVEARDYSFVFDSGTADADPGAGEIRASNADLSAATQLFVSKTSAAAVDVEQFLLDIDTSTSVTRGTLTLTDPATGDRASWRVTGATDATGYVKLALTYHSGDTAFVASNSLAFVFVEKGDAGDGDVPVAAAGDRHKAVIANTLESGTALASTVVAVRSRSFNRPPDPHRDSVALLMHFDYLDGTTKFIDSSPRTKRSITTSGSPVISTAQSLYGGSSLHLDGSSHIILPDHAEYDLGGAAFTLDVAVRLSAAASGDNYFIAKWNTTGNQRSWALSYNSTSTVLRFYYSADGAAASNKSVSWTPSVDTWYKIRVVRTGETLRFFVDGVQVGADQAMAGAAFFASTAALTVGANETSGGRITGWVDELRLTPGVARDSGAAYTAQSAAWPDFYGTLADRDQYLVAPDAVGPWAGQDGKIATLVSGVWQFETPLAGLLADIADEKAAAHFGGSRWDDSAPRPNVLYNPEFLVRWADIALPVDASTTPANNDGVVPYTQWRLLSDGNDIVDVVSAATSGRSAGTANPCRLVVQTADKKFGLSQILTWLDARLLHNRFAAISLAVRSITSYEITAIKLVLLRTRGVSKDACATDLVSAWNAAGANPTWHSDWEQVFAPIEIAVTAQTAFHPDGGSPYEWPTKAVKEYIHLLEESEGGDSGNNYALFAWVDQGTTIGDIIEFGWFKLEAGPTATPYVALAAAVEVNRCEYFVQSVTFGADALSTGATTLSVNGKLRGTMRGTPTLTLIDASPDFTSAGGTVAGSGSTITSSSRDGKGFRATVDGFSGLTTDRPFHANQSTIMFIADCSL